MSNYTLAQIEDALIDSIRKAMPYLRTVKTFEGDVQEEIGESTKNFPAILIDVNSISYEDEAEYGNTPGDMWKTPRYNFYIVSHSLRGTSAARREGQGVYTIIEGLETLLLGQYITLKGETSDMVGVRPWMPFQDTQQIDVNRELAVYVASYGMRILWAIQ